MQEVARHAVSHLCSYSGPPHATAHCPETEKQRSQPAQECQTGQDTETMNPRNCKVCNTLFAPVNQQQNYCSVRCRKVQHNQANQTPKETRHCPQCSTPFVANGPKKFCSPGCRIRAKQQAESKAVAEMSPVAVTLECPKCSHSFVRTHQCQRYCPSCSLYMRHEPRRARIITAKCRECGVLFQSNRSNAAFCSQVCRDDNSAARTMARLEYEAEVW